MQLDLSNKNYRIHSIYGTSRKPGKMYKTGHLLTYLLLKESVANDVKRNKCVVVCWTSLLGTTPSTSGDVVCRPVLTLKADILNITYGSYSQNNNVEIAAL